MPPRKLVAMPPPLPDVDSTEFEALTFPPNLEVTIHNHRIATIADVKQLVARCESRDEVVQVCAELGTKLVDFVGDTQLLVHQYDEFVKSVLDADELKRFHTKTFDFKAVAGAAANARSKQGALQLLRDLKMKKNEDGQVVPVSCLRRISFIDYVTNDLNFGINALNNLRAILGDQTTIQTVGFLNNMIIKHNSTRAAFQRDGLEAQDISEAADLRSKNMKASKGAKTPFPLVDIKLSDLKEQSLVFHPCGLLRRGVFNRNNAFPVFPVEDNEDGLVINVIDDLDNDALEDAEPVVDHPITKGLEDSLVKEGDKDVDMGGTGDAAVLDPSEKTDDVPKEGQQGEKRLAEDGEDLEQPEAKKPDLGKKEGKGREAHSSDSRYIKSSIQKIPSFDQPCDCPNGDVDKSCKLDLKWFIKLANFRDISFHKQRSLLEPMADVIALAEKARQHQAQLMPCPKHLLELCNLIGMEYDRDPVMVASRLARVYKMTESKKQLWSSLRKSWYSRVV